jgi:hypothetical protein
MHKNTTKCNKTLSKWCNNKHGASKIIDTFETYQSHRGVGLVEVVPSVRDKPPQHVGLPPPQWLGGEPPEAPHRACYQGSCPWLLGVWPARPLVTRLPRQGLLPGWALWPGIRPRGSPAWAWCLPWPSGKGSPGTRRLPCHSRWLRKRSKGIDGECHGHLWWRYLASLPSALGHSPGEPSEVEPRLATPVGTARGLCWARKHSSPEPFGPDHWDFNATEEETHRVFEATYKALHAIWAMPSITSSSYPKAVRTCTAPLDLDRPRAGGSPEPSGSGLAPIRR